MRVRSRQEPGGDGRFRHEVLAVVFAVRDDRLHVLLWQRAQEPFTGRWALPGGPLGADERLGTSLGRHLAAKVDLTDIAHLEQLETRSDPDRDIEIMRYGWGSKLDPMLPEGAPAYNSRAIIDACRPFERRTDFPRVAESSPEYLRGVREKWDHALR